MQGTPTRPLCLVVVAFTLGCGASSSAQDQAPSYEAPTGPSAAAEDLRLDDAVALRPQAQPEPSPALLPQPEPETEPEPIQWLTTTALDFGPPGTKIRRDPKQGERQLLLPSSEGERVLLMDDSASDRTNCILGVDPEEDLFVVDIDGDGAKELFISWVYYTGVGHDGAVDIRQVCGWRWTGSELVFLEELSSELTQLDLHNAPAVSAFVQARADAGSEWQDVRIAALPQDDPRTRTYTAGPLQLALTQTGSYFVKLQVPGEPPNPTFELVGLSRWDLDDAGQRTWDFEDSWELRTIEGEPNCCAFDMSPDATGAPYISQGWTHEGSTFLIVRQAQSKVAPQCTVLRVYAGAITGGSPSCEDFLSARAKGPN